MSHDGFGSRPLIADRLIAVSIAEGCGEIFRWIGRIALLVRRLAGSGPGGR